MEFVQRFAADVLKFNLGQDSEARFVQDFGLMLDRDSEPEI